MTTTGKASVRFAILGIGLAGAALLLPGCASAPPPGMLERTPEAAALSSRQLGLLVTDYANGFADAVKYTGDQIEARTSDLPSRRAALLWKIKAVPAVYTAASQADPLFGLADLWILAIQQRQLLADEEMSVVFGAEQPTALATARQLEETAQAVARQALKSPKAYAELEQFVQDFAARHPISDLAFVRQSIAPYYVDFVRDRTDLFRELAAVSDYAQAALTLAVIGLNHVPEIARWQAELTLLDLDRFPAISRATQSFDAVGEAAAELKGVTDELPANIEEQREAILQNIDRQRVATLRDIERLRRAAFADLAREREAMLAGIDQQLQATLAAVGAEREALAGELPNVAGRAGEAMLPPARQAIDHAFWRAIQLAVVVVVLVTAAIGIFRWLRTRAKG